MNTQRVEGHTPTPWVKDYGSTKGHIKSVPEGARPGVDSTPTVLRYDIELLDRNEAEQEANAEFVIYAVNNIERLEKVNEALVRALREIASCPEEDINEQTVHIMLSIARSAMAKEPA